MIKMEQKREEALHKPFGKRTIEDWVIILYSIYRRHNRTCGPYDLWLQVVNDASQLAETIRREIIRTRFPSEGSIYTQLARLFCRISAFVGRYTYDFQSVGQDDSIGTNLLERSLGDYIGGRESYEKWILLKYPYSCPTCGSCPCICASYRNIMEDRDNDMYDEFWTQNREEFMKQKHEYRLRGNELSPRVTKMYDSSIDDWVNMFHVIYSSSHIEVSLESIGFHFLEEIGEVSDGILCLDELLKYKKGRGVYENKTTDLNQKVLDKAAQDPKYIKFLDEYRTIMRKKQKSSEITREYLLQINMTLIKEELADVFSWMCAILNKVRAASKHWNPRGKSDSLSDALHERYRLKDGSVGCSYCAEAICASDCLIGSTIRKSITIRNQKLEHRLFL